MYPAVFLGLACAVFAAAQSSSGPQALQEAIAKHQAGDYKGAIEGYRQFLHEHPDVAGVRSNLGAALASEGLFEDAIREYKLALDVNPSDNRARLNLAIAYYKAADVPEAIAELTKVSNAEPQNRQARVLLANSYLRMGQNKKVIEVLDPIAQIKGTDPAVSYLMGTA